MEEIFKKADTSEGINDDGEHLQNLRYAENVALFNKETKQTEKHSNNLNSKSLKLGLKTHMDNTKYMTKLQRQDNEQKKN